VSEAVPAPLADPAPSGARWYPAPDALNAVAQVAQDFRAAFGRAPDGVWAAPGRVNLIGEHVDYNGGLCLPMALPHRTFVALALRSDDRIGLVSRGLPPWQGRRAEVAPGTVDGWAGYAAGVAWALTEQFAEQLDERRETGFDAAVVSQVPIGAGLSSSAALECAVGSALDDVLGLGLTDTDAGRAALAAACVRAENEIAGAPTGGMDQAASLRGRAGHVLLLDCRDFSVRPVPFDAGAHGLAVLVVDTRAHHALVDGQYGSRREVCEDAARRLGVHRLAEIDPAGLEQALARLDADESRRLVRHVVGEIERVRRAAALLDAGDVRALGPLLDASHASLRDDYEVSCAELDLACDTALAAGALGARMTGGGFGGSAIALVEGDAATQVAERVSGAFAVAGFDPPAFLLAVPSAAAERVA